MTEQTPQEHPPSSGNTREPAHESQADRTGQAGKVQKRYEIDIFRDWCKACGICAAFCPKHCIKLDENGAPVTDQAEQCSGCGWCEVHCPDFAISVRQVKTGKADEQEDEIC